MDNNFALKQNPLIISGFCFLPYFLKNVLFHQHHFLGYGYTLAIQGVNIHTGRNCMTIAVHTVPGNAVISLLLVSIYQCAHQPSCHIIDIQTHNTFSRYTERQSSCRIKRIWICITETVFHRSW